MSSGIIKRHMEGNWKIAWRNPNATTPPANIGQGYVDLDFDISNYKWGLIGYCVDGGGNQRNYVEFPLPQNFGGVRLSAINDQWLTADSTATRYVYHRRITTLDTRIWIGNGMRKTVSASASAAAAGSSFCVPYVFWVR